jgi:hypothetical protein
MITNVWHWVVNHWETVVLVEGTVMALIPVKYNGIVSAIWKVLQAFVVPKK